jgi:hypothetical protein
MKVPVIIIGAPRSGTNMLRDMLVKLDGVDTWPCDEINYIWRHGNISYPSDQFSVEHATPKVKNYLNNEFEKFKKESGAKIVLEKTCASSLRVDFIDKVFPDAKFIYIERDPFDVVGSAKLRWTAKLDIPYLLQKVRYVPLIDLPFYGSRYFWHRIIKLFSKEKRLGSWGPVLPDMQRIVSENDVLEVCAIQWKHCVDKSKSDLINIHNDRIFSIKYEEFVCNPTEIFEQVASFVGKSVTKEVLESVANSVSKNSIGKGLNAMNKSQIDRVKKILGGHL